MTGHHRYQTVELNESVLGELKKLFEAKAEHVHQTLALHSYTSVLSRLQVESYVYRLLSSSSLLRSVALQQQEQGVLLVWTAPCAVQGAECPVHLQFWSLVVEFVYCCVSPLILKPADLPGETPILLPYSPGEWKLNAGLPSSKLHTATDYCRGALGGLGNPDSNLLLSKATYNIVPFPN